MPNPIPSKSFTPPNFIIDHNQENIRLTNIKVGLFADNNAGVLSWSLTADQYNKTQALGSPNNGTVYINLLDEAGDVIPTPGQKITVTPNNVHCREQGTQVWQGKAYGYPTGGDILSTVNNVLLTCETITYDVGPC